jgi:hypothetical protein
MNAITNKLKILMHKTYAISCRIAKKHAVNEISIVKSKLEHMRKECEML